MTTVIGALAFLNSLMNGDSFNDGSSKTNVEESVQWEYRLSSTRVILWEYGSAVTDLHLFLSFNKVRMRELGVIRCSLPSFEA
jgi:hypothetical protein